MQVYEEIGEGQDELDLNGRTINMRAYCSWFNFTGADQQKKVANLSGGERNRLQLAKVRPQEHPHQDVGIKAKIPDGADFALAW